MNTKDAIRLTLIDLMESHKTSGSELADAVGVSKQAVSAWRTGKSSIDIENVPAICQFFGISIGEFFANTQFEEVGSSDLHSLSPDESKLVDAYRATTDFGRHVILKTAVMYRDELPRSAYKDGGLTIYEDMTDEEVSEAIERYKESKQDE